jgi:hypothetical protein
MTAPDPLTHPVSWRRTDRAEYPYAALVAGQNWLIRVNDFPVDPLYTLFIEGREAGDFDDWPGCWQRPG